MRGWVDLFVSSPVMRSCSDHWIVYFPHGGGGGGAGGLPSHPAWGCGQILRQWVKHIGGGGGAGGAGGPGGPGGPGAPLNPGGPGFPCGPIAPAPPGGPWSPAVPLSPIGPMGPTKAEGPPPCGAPPPPPHPPPPPDGEQVQSIAEQPHGDRFCPVSSVKIKKVFLRTGRPCDYITISYLD